MNGIFVLSDSKLKFPKWGFTESINCHHCLHSPFTHTYTQTREAAFFSTAWACIFSIVLFLFIYAACIKNERRNGKMASNGRSACVHNIGFCGAISMKMVFVDEESHSIFPKTVSHILTRKRCSEKQKKIGCGYLHTTNNVWICEERLHRFASRIDRKFNFQISHTQRHTCTCRIYFLLSLSLLSALCKYNKSSKPSQQMYQRPHIKYSFTLSLSLIHGVTKV